MNKTQNLGEGMYMGKKLKNMSREELYKALYNHDQLYREALKDNESETISNLQTK